MKDDRSQAIDVSAQNQEQLFNVLAENIKQPLLHIARQAELARMTNNYTSSLAAIELTADSTLRLLDNYLLSIKLSQANASLEPVSISAVLDNSAHQLAKLAQQFNCDLEVHLAGKYEPVMAHKSGLEAALTSLGYVFIESQSSLDHPNKPVLKLAAHRSHSGIVAGLFMNLEGVSSDIYRRAQNLYGLVQQPSTNQNYANGAGIFVADSLLSSMSAHLRVAKHQKLSGLAATFLPSRQMVLVK